jgi:beta-mannosidase
MRDLAPGAGWGVVDHAGAPKCAYHHLRRALAPTAVWMTGEGLGGIGVHVANDGPEPLAASLRVGLYRDFEQKVGEADKELEVDAHGGLSLDLEALLGRFADASWAYRFGPPAQDLIVASLEREGAGGDELLSQAVHLPAGRPRAVESADRLGLELRAQAGAGGAVVLSLRSRRFVYGLRVNAGGMVAEDDAFSLEPGQPRTVNLKAIEPEVIGGPLAVTALNLQGRTTVPFPG